MRWIIIFLLIWNASVFSQDLNNDQICNLSHTHILVKLKIAEIKTNINMRYHMQNISIKCSAD